MLDWKLIADTVTLLRGGLALLFILLGLLGGPDRLPAAVFLLALCWTGDFVDGKLAQRRKPVRWTWVGAHDMGFDIFVAICLGLYLVLAGYVSVSWAIAYVLAWVVVFRLFGLPFALLELVQAPIYAAMIVIALVNHLPSGLLLLSWILMALYINRQRFTRRIVPEFLDGMRRALRR